MKFWYWLTDPILYAALCFVGWMGRGFSHVFHYFNRTYNSKERFTYRQIRRWGTDGGGSRDAAE